MLRSLVIAGLLALAASTDAAAQNRRPQLEEGARVRVSAPIYRHGLRVKGTSRWIVGTVRATTPTSVVIQTDPADPTSRTEIPYDVIRGMDVSRGRMESGSSVQRGAVRGALVGAGTALVFYGTLSLLPNGDCEEDCTPRGSEGIFETSGSKLARNVGVLVGAGTLIGALVGTRAREKWDSVSIPRVSVIPSAHSARLSFSINF
jgi:hypothetical protein